MGGRVPVAKLFGHDEATASAAEPQLPLVASCVPEENARLRGLGQVSAETIQELGRR